MPIPQPLIDSAQHRFDLTDAVAQAHLYALTEQLLAYPTDEIAAGQTAGCAARDQTGVY